MTIGAAPRPDLTDALRTALPGIDVIEVGALDDLPDEVAPPLPAPDGYPLTTRRRDGRRIVADEAWLAPWVAAAIARAQVLDVEATLLLCAGGFDEVRATERLVRPVDAAVARLRALGARRIGVLVPIAGQVAPSLAKWTALGFEADVAVGPPDTAGHWSAGRRSAGSPETVDAVVLDFVGHPAADVAAAEAAAAPVPVVDLLTASVVMLVATMRR